MQHKSNLNESSDGRDASSTQNVSLDVLCRRAERLIDSVRAMGDQVEYMFSRPQRAIDEANETARALQGLRKQLEEKLAEVRAAEQSCGRRIEEFKRAEPAIQQSAELLIQRIMRARELGETFGQMMETSAGKIALLQSASDEAAKARGAIDNAIRELTRVQKAGDNWTGAVSELTAKHAELIASGNTAASRLRTITDAGERLRETVRQDVVALRELLRESRLERIAWEQLIKRTLAVVPLADTASAQPATQNAGDHMTKSVPAALAHRVRKLADIVQEATGSATRTQPVEPPSAEKRPLGRQIAEPEPVAAGADVG